MNKLRPTVSGLEIGKVNDIVPLLDGSKGSDYPCAISVCRNKKSEKYFIVIDILENEKLKLVTPKIEIKTLQSDLFSEPEDIEDNILIEGGLLSEEQLARYYSSIEEQENEISKVGAHTTNKNCRPEPQYIRSYRSMLNNSNTMPSIMHRIVEQRKQIRWYELVEQLTKSGFVGRGGSLAASLKVLETDGYLQVEGTGESKLISYSSSIERKGTDQRERKRMEELEKLLKLMTKEQKEVFLEKIKRAL